MPLNKASGESAMNAIATLFIADSPDASFKGILVPQKKRIISQSNQPEVGQSAATKFMQIGRGWCGVAWRVVIG